MTPISLSEILALGYLLPGDIVLTKSPQAWLGRAILGMESLIGHCNAQWGHAMTCVGPGLVISQDWRVRRHLISDWSGQEIRIWRNPRSTPEQGLAVVQANSQALGRAYDLLGLFGQALRLLPWLGTWLADHCQDPWRTYCSELVCQTQRQVDPGFLGGLAHCQIDPQDLDSLCAQNGWRHRTVRLA